MKKTFKEIVEGDFRFEGMKEDAQQYLRKIKFINKHVEDNDEDVPMEVIEKLFIKLQIKYPIKMQQITITILDDEMPWYSLSLKNSITHEWLKSFYGMTIYEVYVKATLFAYAYSRKL